MKNRKIDQEAESTLTCILIVESEKQKTRESRIGERILKRGYEKHYQIIRIQKLNNFITDRLKMRKTMMNKIKRMCCWRGRGGSGPEAPTPPAAPHTHNPHYCPIAAITREESSQLAREREMHIHIPRIQDTRTNIVFKRLSVKTATDVGSKYYKKKGKTRM